MRKVYIVLLGDIEKELWFRLATVTGTLFTMGANVRFNDTYATRRNHIQKFVVDRRELSLCYQTFRQSGLVRYNEDAKV
jgi:hypothetical protein